MSSENGSNDGEDGQSVDYSNRRKNSVELRAGRIEVEVEGYAEEEELMELASEQMQEQMRSWVEVDRQVVSTSPDAIFNFGGDL